MLPTEAQLQRECQARRQVLDRVGEKWSLLAVTALSAGPMRFNALRRNLHGISQRILTRTLRGLERDGLVIRKVYPAVPPQVEYSLSPLGQSLLQPAQALFDWAQVHQAQMDAARAQFDAREAQSGPAAD